MTGEDLPAPGRDETAAPGRLYHLEVQDLHVLFDTDEDSDHPVLRVESLRVRLTRAAITRIIDTYAPESFSVSFRIEGPDPGKEVQIVVIATRWGLRATLRARILRKEGTFGRVVVELQPGSSWSPADWTMLELARGQISRQADRRRELRQLGSRSWEIDTHLLVNELLGSQAHIQWGAVLSELDATSEEIRVRFVPAAEIITIPEGE